VVGAFILECQLTAKQPVSQIESVNGNEIVLSRGESLELHKNNANPDNNSKYHQEGVINSFGLSAQINKHFFLDHKDVLSFMLNSEYHYSFNNLKNRTHYDFEIL